MFDLERLILLAPAFLLAITIHEYSHGYIAFRLGDPTAKDAGRLTFNPISHLDIFGTLALLFIGFGWAKPVPVNPRNFANPRQDNLWVALAGPASNFIGAFFFGLLFRALSPLLSGFEIGQVALAMIYLAVWINLILTIFNLLPIPPLDGFHILEGLVSYENYIRLQEFARFGPMILLGLILVSSFARIPIFSIIFSPFLRIFGYLFTGQNFGF
ncbi:MAG: site-2 protease family protein [candidate division Zixibacteria bacterium]|nr:site-2 protease family protein [candidate division Zixibacteria bacterium]